MRHHRLCPVVPCAALPCPALPRPAPPCPALPCAALPCPAVADAAAAIRIARGSIEVARPIGQLSNLVIQWTETKKEVTEATKEGVSDSLVLPQVQGLPSRCMCHVHLLVGIPLYLITLAYMLSVLVHQTHSWYCSRDWAGRPCV